MLGAQIAEGRGKRTSRRIIATLPTLQIEASVEETGTLLGVQGMSIITYTASPKPDGSIGGEGDGVFMSPQGEAATWKAIGVGKFGADGSLHYTGSLSFNSTTPKLMALNGVSGVFQFDIDPQGNTHSTIWEFTSAGATQTASA
jgi:hypothetical protein